MPETDYLKIPQNRIGALIGNKGDVKKSIEKATETILDIDSEDGTVYITPQENMSEVALKLVDDDIYLEVIKLPLYIGKSKNALSRYKGRIIGQNGKTREIIMDMAEVQMAIYGKTVSLIGEMDNLMIAKEAIEMILKGSRHKSVYSFLERKKDELKLKEFKDLVGIKDDEIEFKDGIEFDEEMMK